jgi:ABC-2 type transport system ATP-binding protein
VSTIGVPPAIEAVHLAKHYSVHRKEPGLSGSIKSLLRRRSMAVKAVDDVSFRVDEGEMVGFLGPNGAGKTTTLKLLSGLLHPTAGEARVLGYVPWRRETAYLKQLSLVMGQKNQLWWDIPAMDTFLLNKEIYEIPNATFRRVLADLTDLLDLDQVLHVQVRKLSLGERMKCELAAALLHSPRVLFLDEPTIGLDVVMQKKIRDFVRGYRQRYGATMLLTSHYMDDVKELCDRVIIVDHGHVIYDGALEQIVARYAGYRVLVATFERPVSPAALAPIGEVAAHEPLKATLHVPRQEVSARAAQLLSSFPTADLTIEEPEIDDIIRQVFAGQGRVALAVDAEPAGATHD